MKPLRTPDRNGDGRPGAVMHECDGETDGPASGTGMRETVPAVLLTGTVGDYSIVRYTSVWFNSW